MKFNLNKREIEVSINAMSLAIGSIVEELKKESVSQKDKEDLEKDRKILVSLVHRLTIPLITMD